MKRLIATLVFFDLLCSAQFPKPVASQGWAGAVPGVQSGEYLYCASAVGTDSYACPLVPAIAAYTTGMAVQFKVDVANTGACTLALNGLAAKPIKRGHDVDPADGEIEIGTVVTLVYDGTNWQMQSQTGLGGGAPGGFSNLLNAGYPVTVASAGQATQTAILGSAVGGTGSGFTKFSGPTTTEKTFTVPDASSMVATGAGTTNALSKYTTGASGIIGDSALSDDGVKLFTTAARTFGFGLATRTGNTEPGTTKFVINDMDLAVLNSATLGSEQLTNGALTAGTSWSAAGDCALAGDALACAYAAGTGSLTQANATLAIKIPDSKWMTWTYVVSGVSGTVSASLPATICDSTLGLSCVVDMTAGTKTFKWKTVATASTAAFVTNFVLAAASGLTVDTLSLKEQQGGDINAYGNVNSRGGTVYGGSGATAKITRAGLSQGAVNLDTWQTAAGATVLYVDSSGNINTQGYVSAVTNLYGISLYVGGLNDIRISRTSAGRFEGNSGTAGKFGGFNIGTIALQSLATPVITSVTPSANNGITCTYVLVARQGDNTATTQGSAALGTVAGPTDCNSNTVVWTAVAGVTYYQLNRTVGGATQGMITAMAAWLNNTTNCPAGVCTYIDTGTAAAGAVPVANTTGQVVSRSYNTETACASAAGACGTASAGHFSMSAAATTATVSTTAVNANSQIFIQENSTLGALLGVTCNATVVRTYAVSTVTAGVSFVVTASAAPITNPSCLSFVVAN